MNLFAEIMAAYPELTDNHFLENGVIELKNDTDGFGDYIAKWDYDQPIPAGLTLGKPS